VFSGGDESPTLDFHGLWLLPSAANGSSRGTLRVTLQVAQMRLGASYFVWLL
jgi:hypothetical protein